MENGEEQEKQKTNRRSSILKMPKARNPIEEIDTTETFTDISASKPVRRVSFASSNYIKPFVADPEQNTIWDTTYEEDVNHTNSTQSSQDQISTNCTKLGSTLGVSHEVPVDATNVFEQNMEFTEIFDKENFPLYANTKLSIVDYARKSNVSVASANMQKANSNGVSFNTTKSSMELTCQNLNVLMKDDQKVWREKSVYSKQEVEMAGSSNTETLSPAAMEFTCQIPRLEINQQKPTLFKEHNDDNNMEFTRQVSQNKLIGAENTMEFTCLQQSNLLKAEQDQLHSTKYNSKLNNTEFTCQKGSNLTTFSQSMELTGYETLPVSRNLDQDFTMELTCQVNAQKANELEYTKLNNTEFACQKGSNLTTFSQSMELTGYETLLVSRNLDQDFTMELTCQVNAQKGNKLEYTKLNNTEFTCQKGSNLTTFSQNMELTGYETLPVSRNLDQDFTMELTCQVNAQKANELEYTKENNLTNEVNLEQYPSKLIDVELPERHITNTSEGMEFSCQISQNETKLSKQMIHAKTSELNNHDQVHEDYILDSGKKITITSQVNSVQIEKSRQIGSSFNRSETFTSHSKVNDKSASLQEKSYSDMEVEETYNMTTAYPDSTKPDLPNLCINESKNQLKSCLNSNETMQSSKMSVQDISSGANNLKLEKMSDKEKIVTDYISEDKENLPSKDRNKIFSTLKTSLNSDTTNLLGNHENPQKVVKSPLAKMSVQDISSGANNLKLEKMSDKEKTVIKSNIHSKISITSQVNSVQIENSRQVGSNFNRSETLTSHSKVNDKSASLQEKSCSDMEVEETYMTTTYPDSTKPDLPNLCISESTNQLKSGIKFNETMQSSKMSVQDISSDANNLKLEKMSDKEKTVIKSNIHSKIPIASQVNNVQIENSPQVGSNFNRSETLTSHSKVNDKSASLQEKSCSDMEVEETYITTAYPDSTKPDLPNLCINASTNQLKSYIDFNETMQSSKMSVQDISSGANNLKLEKMSDKEKTIIDYISEDKENLPSKDRNKIFSSLKTSLNSNTTNLLGNHENPQKVAKSPLAVWKSETSIAKNESKPQRESELICTFPETQNLSPKTNPRKLHDLSDFAMGSFMEPYFHFNLTNISSSVDDTQHLLQCTYSKSNPVSLMKSRIEDKNASGFTLNLEEAGLVSKPNLTGLSQLDDTKYSPDISLCRNKLSNYNDTYVLKNKKDTARNVEEEASCSNNEEDTSLGLIPQGSIDGLDERGLIKLPVKFELKEFKYEIKRISEVSDLLENIRKQKEHITNYLENFEFRPMRIPEFLPNSRKSSSDRTSSSGSTEDDISIVDSSTIEKKIKDKQKNSQNCWKLEEVDEDIYHFSTLFGALRFVVNLDQESGRVFNIEASSKLAADSKLEARYIMKLFLEKLGDNHIKSAIGDRYDILSLLDYVQMKMREFHHLQHDLIWRCQFLTMEENFVAKFTLLSVPLILSCQIFVNVSDPENLKDEDIKIITRKGSVNENDIKDLVRNCPKGLDFFTSFQKSLENYLKAKEERMNV